MAPEEEAHYISPTHNVPPDVPTPPQNGLQPAPAGNEPWTTESRDAPHNISVTSQNGAEQIKPNTEKHVCLTDPQAMSRRTTTLFNKTHGPETLRDKMVPLKKIKLEEPMVEIDNQHSKTNVEYEDALSTLAAVVCFSGTDRKDLDEKLFGPQASDVCCLKSEPQEPHQCQSNQRESPNIALNQSLPNVRSLVQHRNITADQAIAIEALTQLAATPQTVETENQRPHSASSDHIPLCEAKSVSDGVSNKVSVISSSLHQTSVIRSTLNRQANFAHHCSSTPKKLSLKHLLMASSECEKLSSAAENRRYDQALCKSERFEGTFKKSKQCEGASRRRDEEEVAAQLVQLAFVIESRQMQVSENSPPNGMPPQTTKYNGQHLKKQRKPRMTPSKPRISKKKACEDDGNQCRIPLARRTPNRKPTPLKATIQKAILQQKMRFQHKRSPFLPQAQIDLKKYIAEARHENRQLLYYSSSLKKEHTCSGKPNGFHFKYEHAAQSDPQPNGLFHNHANDHLGASQLQRHECEQRTISQVSKTYDVLNPGANQQPQHTMPSVPCKDSDQQHLHMNQNGYYRVEKSGGVTVLSTPTGHLQNGDLEDAEEETPTKHTLNSFLESPGRFLNTPTRNLLNTPSKQLTELPSCDCVG